MGYYWKCRCMCRDNVRMGNGGVDMFDFRMNICQSVYLYGLHREWYRIVDCCCEDLLCDDNLALVKHRVSSRVLR